MRKITKVLAAGICCAAVLASCGKKPAEPQTQADTTAETHVETTTAAVESSAAETQKEEVKKGDVNKKAILIVSFGTSYNETRAKTIDAIVAKVAAAYPDFEVRSAFTSQTIIDKIKSADGLEIDNVEQAMQKLADEGYGTLVVQPTFIMAGIEFFEMIERVDPYLKYFPTSVIGEAMLTYPEDFETVAKILIADTASYNDEGTGFVFLGHGTEHDGNEVYITLEEAFAHEGVDNYFVGTVEAEPTLEDVMKKVEATGSDKVVLLPLMITAGDHANNDMAGDGGDSWKNRFEAAGYEVECVLQGLGEYEAIQDLMVTHVQDSLDFIQ